MRSPQATLTFHLLDDGRLIAETSSANGTRRKLEIGSLEDIRDEIKLQDQSWREKQEGMAFARHDRVCAYVAANHPNQLPLVDADRRWQSALLRKAGIRYPGIATAKI